MAYDSQRERTVLFGGYSTAYHGDTWEWNGSAWALASSVGPAPRIWGAVAYDTQRSRLVLFGGFDGQSTFYGDTWAWDGSAWAAVSSAGPGARTGHAMVFDSQRGRVVLFGGHVGNGAFVNDTWEWDGSAWLQVAATGPAAREAHRMAFDSQRNRTVLFGGYSTGSAYTQFSDTWEWDGAVWVQSAAVGPVSRTAHQLTFDSRRGVTILYGGWNWTQGGAPLGTVLGDTWAWDGVAWSQAPTLGIAARQMHAMAFDSIRGRSVLFGGVADTGALLGDTWELVDRQQLAVPYGAGCGNPSLSLLPSVTAAPIINSTAEAHIGNIPAGLAVTTVGWQRTSFGPWALPLSLGGFGLPGCDLWHSTDIFGLGVTASGVGAATFSQPIPNSLALVGQHVYLQAFAVAPGANPLQVIVSNGLDWQIGY